MGTSKIRMFSLWVMVVILLLLGVHQGHARPLTWPGGPPDYSGDPQLGEHPADPEIRRHLGGPGSRRREQPRPVHPRGRSG